MVLIDLLYNTNYIRCVWLILLVSGISTAQESRILEGKVTSKEKDVTGIAIQNITSRSATITDADGNFFIMVRHNDTLMFSAVQYKRKMLVVSEELFSTSFVNIPMEAFVNELKEVVVKPYNLSGNLNRDLSGLQLEKDVSAEALKLPNARVRIISQSENKLHDADHGKFFYFYGLGMAFNVNKILNRLSGRTKKLKKRVLLDKEYEKVKEIEESFSDSVLINVLKIPKDRFHDFIYYCQMEAKFESVSENKDQLLLWQFLVLKSKAYREENNLD
ncbi:carboxypeptidase-like regulatory domain-containing protein [Flagellimonas pacifica]|uniref:CarboxypepD_reg-like domain-containing protein n=1 Tax=Flagellimonas pacifica TaxID=1247520 RepID=A0A285MYY6_9FLAO|nr:carboxypeptidase-like regulatory domain-containing protein [Allomuricauda parva]SNZ01893.1 CarboxypepD_reg-like domain-containing protein [Allomuricauda parva]